MTANVRKFPRIENRDLFVKITIEKGKITLNGALNVTLLENVKLFA